VSVMEGKDCVHKEPRQDHGNDCEGDKSRACGWRETLGRAEQKAHGTQARAGEEHKEEDELAARVSKNLVASGAFAACPVKNTRHEQNAHFC